VVALALRPQIAAIGPLAPEIGADLGVPHAVVGLLTTIPVLCMGLFAPLGPSLARRLGAWAGIAASVALLVGSGLLRAATPGVAPVLAITVGIGVGTALSGPILAMFVRERMPDRRVAGTAAYAGGTILGAAVATVLAVPLAGLFGGWRGSLIVMTVGSGVTLVAWLVPRTRHAGDPAGTVGEDPPPAAVPAGPASRRLPVDRPIAWAIGVLFGLQSWLYYGATAWLPSAYIEQGWDASAAAVLLALVYVASLVATLLAPAGAGLGLSRRLMLLLSTAAALLGLAGMVGVPGAGPVWAISLGLGLGSTFTLLLTLPTDISVDPREVGATAAMMLLVGYLLASVGPFVLGAARDATGSFAVSLWVLVVVAVVMLPLSASLTPHRLRPAGDEHSGPRPVPRS